MKFVIRIFSCWLTGISSIRYEHQALLRWVGHSGNAGHDPASIPAWHLRPIYVTRHPLIQGNSGKQGPSVVIAPLQEFNAVTIDKIDAAVLLGDAA